MLQHDVDEEMQANYRVLCELCDRLEAVADSLPHHVDAAECLALASLLGPSLLRIEAFEEATLFPALLGWSKPNFALDDTIVRLTAEHRLDQGYAEDVQEMLYSYGQGRPTLWPDAAGFMLRGFFESMRRHIAFERQLLLPLLQLGNHGPI